MRSIDHMAGLMEDSDSDHSLKSVESDDESVLPSYATIISSPLKKVKLETKVEPGISEDIKPLPAVQANIEPPLSAPLIGQSPSKVLQTQDAALMDDSPVKSGHSHQKAIKKGEKLSKKLRQLSESSKTRKDTAEKLEKYKLQGGVLGLSKIWEEHLQESEDEDEPFGTGRNPSDLTSLTDLPKLESVDNTPSLPIHPPGTTLFVNTPSLLEDLYPPCVEITTQGGPLEGVEKVLLNQDSTEGLTNLVTSQWLGLCYREKSCPESLWQWLFQIMCRSCDYELSYGAYSNLVELMNCAKGRDDLSSVFCPKFDDIVEALVSLGVDKERLKNNSLPNDDDSVFSPSQTLFDNLTRLTKYLKLCVDTCPQHYTVTDLNVLILLLFKVALDVHVCKSVQRHEITLCIGAVVQAIPASTWKSAIERLTNGISELFRHHHDRLYAMQLLTGMYPRLSMLQISLCRKNIEALLGDRLPSTKSLTNAEFAKQVVRYFYTLKSPSYDYEMCYEMYSILAMLALFLNRSHVPWAKPNGEREFARLLGALSDKVRDHSSHPERGVVKDLLIRMKLDFDGQKMTAKQPSITDCFSSTK